MKWEPASFSSSLLSTGGVPTMRGPPMPDTKTGAASVPLPRPGDGAVHDVRSAAHLDARAGRERGGHRTPGQRGRAVRVAAVGGRRVRVVHVVREGPGLLVDAERRRRDPDRRRPLGVGRGSGQGGARERSEQERELHVDSEERRPALAGGRSAPGFEQIPSRREDAAGKTQKCNTAADDPRIGAGIPEGAAIYDECNGRRAVGEVTASVASLRGTRSRSGASIVVLRTARGPAAPRSGRGALRAPCAPTRVPLR